CLGAVGAAHESMAVWPGMDSQSWNVPFCCLSRQGRVGGEVGAFGVTVHLLSGQEPGDRDSGVARSAPGGGEGSLSLSRRDGCVPARHDAVLLSDLVLYLDVQAGMGPAVACHELAHACWTGHFRLGAGDVPHEIGGYQLVNQVEPPLVEDRLDEQLDPELVELADVLHLRHRLGRPITRTREDPRGFPPRFCLAMAPTREIASGPTGSHCGSWPTWRSGSRGFR